MSVILYGLCGAALVGVGLYGLITGFHLIRLVLGFNVLGSGIFLLFGSLAARHPSLSVDPVPQAMIITGIVVALAGSATALALISRMHEETGRSYLDAEAEDRDDDRR
ncbi:MAG: NADH-quinone oxidoreductase subunit K [Pseudomonadota bacterium]|nr:NADH-quinone oxidoreductase subunit K [Pseudomonadota bacterium]